MSKETAVAPSNIAFTKYWGKKDEVLRLPENGSVSMCLSALTTTTTVEFSPTYTEDQVTINGETEEVEESRVIKHLDRIRQLAGINLKARMVSENNFPIGHGLSSSASGFAALTVAASAAAGLKLSEKELTILARQGSGSACRSIPAGFVEWLDGDTSETSYATTVFPADYWNIADVVAIASEARKEVSTTAGQESATSSPFLPVRLARMAEKNQLVKDLIEKRDFTPFGELLEAEALELHSIMITQTPPLIYMLPNTILLIKLVRKWRQEGLESYFTINTGQDVHIIVEQKNIDALQAKLKEVPEVKDIIVNTPSQGAHLVEDHLF